MRPRKLTPEQAAHIRAVGATRRALPTNAQLAKKFAVSKRVIDEITRGRAYKILSDYRATARKGNLITEASDGAALTEAVKITLTCTEGL